MENNENSRRQPTYRLGYNMDDHDFPKYGFRLTGPAGEEYRLEFNVEGDLVVTACGLSAAIVVKPCVKNQIALSIDGEW